MTDKPTEAEIKKQATIFNQAQVDYKTLSTQQAKACANCVFFRDTGFDGIDWQHCHLVEAYPEPILPTGICNEWRAKPEPPPELTEQIGEALAEVVSDAAETISDAIVEAMPVQTLEMAAKETPRRTPIIERIKQLISPQAEPDAEFSVHKGSDGKWYWIARYTNAYEDKEKEIFTEAAHEGFIKRLDMGLVDMPELWTYHVKGSKHGQADVVFGVGRIVVAVGHFDDTPEAQKAIKFYQKNKVKLSHGAKAPKWAIKEDGSIEAYNTFEISTLPVGAEANPYTSYEAVKAMQPDPKKIEWVAGVLGKEKAQEIVQGTAEYSKELDAMEIRYKDFADVVEKKPADQPSDELQKSMSETFIQMVEEQGQVVSVLKAMEKRQDGGDTLVKELQKQVSDLLKEVTELRKTVNAGPRAASTDTSTTASQDETEKAKAQIENAAQPADKSDPFAQFYKKSANGSN